MLPHGLSLISSFQPILLLQKSWHPIHCSITAICIYGVFRIQPKSDCFMNLHHQFSAQSCAHAAFSSNSPMSQNPHIRGLICPSISLVTVFKNLHLVLSHINMLRWWCIIWPECHASCLGSFYLHHAAMVLLGDL